MAHRTVQTATWNREDRDLLVELKTTLAAVQTDIKEIKDGTAAKLRELETEKVSRADMTRITVGIQETFNSHRDDIDKLSHGVEGLNTSRAEFRTSIKTWGVVWGFITFAAPIALAIYLR